MFRRKLLWINSTLLALSLVLAGCASAATPLAVPTLAAAATATALQPATATPGPVTLTDSLGRQVTLASPALRVVSLAPSNTEILFALDKGATLVARDDYSDYPAQATQIPSIGNNYPNVNAEAIVALHPDLVLAAGLTNPDDVKHLADLGLTVYATSNAGSLEDIYNDISAVGALVGASTAAEALVTQMQNRVLAVQTKAETARTHPVVFYEIDATDPSNPWTAGPGSFIDQLITLAGGTNAGNIAKDKYAQLSLEQVVTQDPDIIVLGSATFGGQTPELVAARAGWKDIKAVKNGAVYSFDDNLVSRPGPRVVDGLQKLLTLIHPELYQ